MSLKRHLFWRSLCMICAFLAALCSFWIAREIVTWNKTLLEAFVGSWWNFLGVGVFIVLVAFTSWIDDMIGLEKDEE